MCAHDGSFGWSALNAGASGIRDEIPFSLSQKPPLELAAELVRMLAPAAAQIVPEVFVGLALPPLHDRAEQLPPERLLATFPCRGEERGRKCLQCHGGLLVSRLPPIRSEPVAARARSRRFERRAQPRGKMGHHGRCRCRDATGPRSRMLS